MEVAEKNLDLLQLNMTGMRVIVLFSLLLESPKTVEEINDAYDKNPLIKDKVSYDTIRNDINALRDAGCVISRTTKTNNKYILISHPFGLDFSNSYLKSIEKVYNSIYTTLSFDELFAFDNLFYELSLIVTDSSYQDKLLQISKLSGIDKTLLKDLLKYSSLKNQITVLYKSQAGDIKKHNLLAEKVAFRHGKLYFFCIDLDWNKNAFYLVNRIHKIVDVKLKADKPEFKKFKAKYKILNINKDNYVLSDNEKIIDDSAGNLIIEAETDNDFIMMQNVLSLGRNCVVLEPIEFRNKMKLFITNIREMYNGEK